MTDYIFNRAVVRDYLCAECHSGLKELCLDGDYRVVCSHEPCHQGKVRKSTVEMLRTRSVSEGIEVRMAFPELAPPAREDSVATAMEELYGPQRPARRTS